VQREVQDLCTFQQHVVQQAQQLGSYAAPPAVTSAFLSAATHEGVGMWWDRHHAGQLQLLQQREQRAAGLLHQGQALRDRLTAEQEGQRVCWSVRQWRRLLHQMAPVVMSILTLAK
jgi:hypothetical protein